MLVAIENALWPDLFIAGGGISRKADKWVPLLENRTPVVPAAPAEHCRHSRRRDGCQRGRDALNLPGGAVRAHTVVTMVHGGRPTDRVRYSR